MPGAFYRCLCLKQIKVSKEHSTTLVIKSLCENIGFVVDKRAYIQKYEYKGHGERTTTWEVFQ